jgi:hypothetical protein
MQLVDNISQEVFCEQFFTANNLYVQYERNFSCKHIDSTHIVCYEKDLADKSI